MYSDTSSVSCHFRGFLFPEILYTNICHFGKVHRNVIVKVTRSVMKSYLTVIWHPVEQTMSREFKNYASLSPGSEHL